MKKLTSVLLALALLTPAALSAATFEGTIKMNVTAPGGKAMPITYRIKSGLSRVEMQAEGQTMATIIDPAKQQATMLMPEQKMYMVHSFAGMTAQQGGGAAEDVSLEKTSVQEKILGYDTTKYIAKTKDATTEIWATEELGSFGGMSGGNPMGGSTAETQAWEKVLRGKAIFPLRVVSTGKKGKEAFRMEATDVKKESLSDSLFTPPADFQKFDMGAMMRGLGMPK